MDLPKACLFEDGLLIFLQGLVGFSYGCAWLVINDGYGFVVLCCSTSTNRTSCFLLYSCYYCFDTTSAAATAAATTSIYIDIALLNSIAPLSGEGLCMR